ncbi:hypothetical protein DPMN_172783 [Dreissena polymorpha]|uniref:Uncharacterized protein n=1 Tax=Dreissena polymorpha TaxID=45954 RepID=A0A9D4E3I5_DREPO|nr:hypothetical protein DPMN_172783 [Dreissena polymorpha]
MQCEKRSAKGVQPLLVHILRMTDHPRLKDSLEFSVRSWGRKQFMVLVTARNVHCDLGNTCTNCSVFGTIFFL